ncbi:hypothetical protein WICMUC_002480 [Wickerhamomyces mucosus]|uniref:Small ribosomal subunit protein mS41 n=1 Tax=Wickerhamomyces mucosus TaxID=1378264 RepID=A0A9P8PQU4_9ASCO|nr:hypothetical protein WICMUC_002480 [Wickerhamomyces mucosus]
MFITSLRTNILQKSLIIRTSTRFQSTIPKPTSAIPDVETFLNKIGRNSSEHLEIFPEWSSLFTITSRELKEKGIDTAARRYLLNQINHLRNGDEIRNYKQGKKSFYGGEYKRNEKTSKILAERRAERIKYEEAAQNK